MFFRLGQIFALPLPFQRNPGPDFEIFCPTLWKKVTGRATKGDGSSQQNGRGNVLGDVDVSSSGARGALTSCYYDNSNNTAAAQHTCPVTTIKTRSVEMKRQRRPTG